MTVRPLNTGMALNVWRDRRLANLVQLFKITIAMQGKILFAVAVYVAVLIQTIIGTLRMICAVIHFLFLIIALLNPTQFWLYLIMLKFYNDLLFFYS